MMLIMLIAALTALNAATWRFGADSRTNDDWEVRP